jgi:hypothetical protein
MARARRAGRGVCSARHPESTTHEEGPKYDAVTEPSNHGPQRICYVGINETTKTITDYPITS